MKKVTVWFTTSCQGLGRMFAERSVMRKTECWALDSQFIQRSECNKTDYGRGWSLDQKYDKTNGVSHGDAGAHVVSAAGCCCPMLRHTDCTGCLNNANWWMIVWRSGEGWLQIPPLSKYIISKSFQVHLLLGLKGMTSWVLQCFAYVCILVHCVCRPLPVLSTSG